MGAQWGTKFGSWLRSHGIQQLTRDLRHQGITITRGAAYHWLEGRSMPRRDVAIAITRVSQGLVTVDDIYRHPEEASKT